MNNGFIRVLEIRGGLPFCMEMVQREVESARSLLRV
jgi:hypothetical protein